MKKCSFFVCLLLMFAWLVLLTGCEEEQQPATQEPPIPLVTEEELKHVEHVGQVPEEFRGVIANNLFRSVTAFEDRLLNAIPIELAQSGRPVTYEIQMMDLYGNLLATHTCHLPNDDLHLHTLTATDDGGFLFVLGFNDNYSYEEGTWAGEDGIASHIIKCDKAGNVQFDITIGEIEGNALKTCLEKNGRFYFFGSCFTPETNTTGVYSPTDIYMLVVDKNGTVLNCQTISGSDFDTLMEAEEAGDQFVLSIVSQSDDGDFEGSQSQGYSEDWVFVVNEDLEIVSRERKAGRSVRDNRLGEKDGAPIYSTDVLLNDFDAGNPTAFMDYGDFYLIVSTNNTGIYEDTPTYISSIWYYKETVYSAYDYSGNLLFRTAVNSTPEYGESASIS